MAFVYPCCRITTLPSSPSLRPHELPPLHLSTQSSVQHTAAVDPPRPVSTPAADAAPVETAAAGASEATTATAAAADAAGLLRDEAHAEANDKSHARTNGQMHVAANGKVDESGGDENVATASPPSSSSTATAVAAGGAGSTEAAVEQEHVTGMAGGVMAAAGAPVSVWGVGGVWGRVPLGFEGRCG